MRKLERAMLLYLRYPITQYALPIYPDKKLRPRLQLLDSGLMNYALGIQTMYFQLKASKDSPASIGGGGIAPKGCLIPPYMV